MVAQQKKMVDTYKTTSEISAEECCMGTKQCFLCPKKYPCKVHNVSRFWEGDAVCLGAQRAKMTQMVLKASTV